jgi:hypothetical protein
MRSLRNVKMKKVINIFATKDDVRKARASLEAKTEKAFADFAKSKQKVLEQSHLRYLD